MRFSIFHEESACTINLFCAHLEDRGKDVPQLLMPRANLGVLDFIVSNGVYIKSSSPAREMIVPFVFIVPPEALKSANVLFI